MNLVVLILSPVVLTAISVTGTENKRFKRLLYGDFIESFGPDADYQKWISPYDALYYSVGMKPGWGFTVYDMEWDAEKQSWDEHQESRKQTISSIRNNRCGGAFLTPLIVQTACHCVAHFYGARADQKIVWEEPLVIYASLMYWNTAKLWGDGFYSPAHYYAHRKCAPWYGNQTRIITYDYGLILLAKGNFGLNFAKHDFPRTIGVRNLIEGAPYYTVQDLNKHYLNIIKKQSICLFIGHGYDKLDLDSGLISIDERKEPYRRPESALHPRHNWQAVCGYRLCHDFVQSVAQYHKIVVAKRGRRPSNWTGFDIHLRKPVDAINEAIFHPNFTENATFSCSMDAGKTQAVPTVGDGGYPVTCNNVYFAIQGMGYTRTNRMDRMSYQSPITFAKWENAAEYRASLKTQMLAWAQYIDTVPSYTTKRFAGIQSNGPKFTHSAILLLLVVYCSSYSL